jgi:rhodanese-related sulfurtransferase
LTRIHRTLAITAAILGAAAALADLSPRARRGMDSFDPAALADEIDAERDHISALELGERIMRGDQTLRVLDLRSAAEFEQDHIPGASHTSITELVRNPQPKDADLVLYSEGGAHAAQAWVLLRTRGFRRVFFLREGLYEWNSRVFAPRLAVDATASERAEFQRAAELSRFFGGIPRSGVPRSEVPAGYWTDGRSGESTPKAKTIRRRGC